MDLQSAYIEELKEDTKVDELNLKEKALYLPGIKAKWVARIINHKNILYKLEKQKPNIINSLIEQIKKEAPIKLHNTIAKEKAELMPEAEEINQKIADEKLLIEFLEKAEKIFSSMSFDISNIVKIVQLETT
jgi:hypothetical protein